MFLSIRLGMLALHRGIRSIGHTLKSFILRCLFYWPHVFRNLRRIWSLCSRTSPKDIAKKKGGQAGPLFPGALGVCHGEGHNIIYASRDFNRANALHFTSGPGNAEALHLSPVMVQSQSVPPSPYPSHTPSLHGSLRRSDRRLSASSNTPSITSSYIANDVRRVPTPLTLTHARVTSTHFAGAPPDRPRSWSRSRSPSQPQSPLPSLSPLPNLLPPLHLQSLPESSIQESSSNTHIMNVVPISQDTSEGYLRHDIMIFPPPRSQSIDLDSQFTTSRRVSVETNPVALADGLGIWPDGKMRSIRLMHSEQVSRYVNKGDVLPVNSEYILRPMELDLPQYSYAKCPEGWAPVTHPGGAVYFYHAEQRTLTDVYMYDPDLSAEIQALAAHLDSERTRHGTSIFPTDDYDLVLDIVRTGNDEIIWAYYYVNHNTKSLFWLHSYECGDSLLREVRGVREASHVKLRLESLYWVHWSLYPTGPEWRRFPENASNELLGALLSSGIDSLTSKVSTSPFTVAEMESMRDFIKEAKNLGTENPHVITSVARLLSFYAHWRFLHFHGQKTSRQDRYKSIYKGGHRKRTILIRIFSPILFFFPDAYLRELQKLWMDKIIVEALWKESTQRVVSEWSDFVLYSTVMLTANVAFLAVPGVIVVPQSPIPPNTWIKPSPAQIASSISLVFSIGSIITGLLLIRRNRTMMTKDPNSVWHYLYGMKWPVVGLEPLAIAFSLTYALLMWSVWGFFVALLIFSFQDTSSKIWIAVGIAAGIVIITVIWCIKNTWDPEEREEEHTTDRPYEPELKVWNGTQA